MWRTIGPSLKPGGFSEKILNPGLKGIKCCVQKRCFLDFLSSSPKGPKDLSNFLQECSGATVGPFLPACFVPKSFQ